jgi:hypothetical protein
MIEYDEDALICDLAETYGIYDYRSLPARTVATLAVGLRNDSRIKMKLGGTRIPYEEMLLTRIYDVMNFIAWTKTKDATKGKGRPKSLYDLIMNPKTEEKEIVFDSADEFESARRRMLEEM